MVSLPRFLLRRSISVSTISASTIVGLALSLAIVTVPLIPASVQAYSSTTQAMSALKRTGTRWIEVNLSRQRLIAWEGRTPVYAVVISTGTSAHPTLPGAFEIQSKHRTTRMQGDDYDVPDVPYTMYYDGGYAIHGAYWHRSFGTPVSHGCVNVAVDHARWLFNWATIGTPVVVHR
ncbi:MAG TPA: L,D-transpeptidase [Trichocoleus sp.]|jgi:lipoprotein-anchoring transpeptidase ErfK/SrfK